MAKQHTLTYAMVARGRDTVLTESIDNERAFKSIAFQCLQKLPSSASDGGNKFTFKSGVHTYNYLIHTPFTFCVVAEGSAGTLLPVAFLERLKDDFVSRYGTGKNIASSASLIDYGPILIEHLNCCTEHSEEVSKIARVKAQVSEVKSTMAENIGKVVGRGTQIDVLVDKTNSLSDEAQNFRSTGDEIRRKMWWKNTKMKIILLTILIALILIIVLSICKGFSC